MWIKTYIYHFKITCSFIGKKLFFYRSFLVKIMTSQIANETISVGGGDAVKYKTAIGPHYNYQ